MNVYIISLRFGWAYIMPMKVDKPMQDLTGEAVTEVLMELFWSVSRYPLTIQTDNGAQFICDLLR